MRSEGFEPQSRGRRIQPRPSPFEFKRTEGRSERLCGESTAQANIHVLYPRLPNLTNRNIYDTKVQAEATALSEKAITNLGLIV